MSEVCYHCNLPISGKPKYQTIIQGKNQPMCCPGCQAVASAITFGGLENYYNLRTNPAKHTDCGKKSLISNLKIYDDPKVQKDFVIELDQSKQETELLLEGISCPACVWLLEKTCQQIQGVNEACVNLTRQTLRLCWDSNTILLSDILLKIYKIGYKAYPYQPDKQQKLVKKQQQQAIRRLGIAGIGMMQVVMYALALYLGAFDHMDEAYRNTLRWASLILTTPIILYSARPFYTSAKRALYNKNINMDVPVCLAISSAYLASLWATFKSSGEVYFDSVTMFVFFLLLGRFLEMNIRQRNKQHTDSLLAILPTSCEKWSNGKLRLVSIKELKPGDKLRVKAGQIIPADAKLVSQVAQTNESVMTGESRPISHAYGDLLTGGSINLKATIDVEVIKTGSNTKLGTIARLLDKAATQKPKITLFADKIAKSFVLTVLVVAALTGLIWYFIAPENTFWVTLSVLLVTCPCALSLATPTAITSATYSLHRLGLIVVKADFILNLAKVNHIIFDKTGTLTSDRPVLETIKPLGKQNADELNALATALEKDSLHPIAQAFLGSSPYKAFEKIEVPSQGVSGIINQHQYHFGKPTFACSHLNIKAPDNGKWLLLSKESQPIGWFKIREEIANGTKEITRNLIKHYKVSLFSGDATNLVEKAANVLGIDNYQGQMLAQDKLTQLKTLRKQNQRILMVGDGINDTLILAAADASIAVGNSNDLVKTSADAILLNKDLTQLQKAIKISKHTNRIIKQNLAWALLYNGSLLPLACMGQIKPWMAAIGMTASSLIVMANSLRIGLRGKSPNKTLASLRPTG